MGCTNVPSVGGDADATRSSAAPIGRDDVADVLLVILTLLVFALLGLAARGVEKL
jgi:hypothetical protein